MSMKDDYNLSEYGMAVTFGKLTPVNKNMELSRDVMKLNIG